MLSAEKLDAGTEVGVFNEVSERIDGVIYFAEPDGVGMYQKEFEVDY